MTRPRQILDDSFYMVTRRCVQRQHLLRPDDETNNALLYCLLEAARRTGVEVILPSFLSNHHHTIVHDKDGNIVDFLARFHKLAAKCVNAIRGRRENVWSVEQVSVVRLMDRSDVMDKLVYAATNPVKHGLVERVADWPGINGLSNLLEGRPLEARRPRFFRERGAMPEDMSLGLSIPEALGDPDEFRRELRERIARAEAAFSDERRRAGRRVVGRKAVLAQSWRAVATKDEPRGGLRPEVAARNRWMRAEALEARRLFLEAYRVARRALLDGHPAEFPAGTYWLRRYAGVRVVGVA